MGRDKSSLPFGEETALQRCVRIVQAAASPVVVVGTPAAQRPPLPQSVRFVHDAHPNEGPLAGLLSGLQALRGTCGAAWLCGCDQPLLQPQIIHAVAAALDPDAEIALVSHQGHRQPLLAVYRITLLDRIHQLLANGERSLQGLLRTSRLTIVPSASLRKIDPELNSLRNMNDDADYQQLLRLAFPMPGA